MEPLSPRPPEGMPPQPGQGPIGPERAPAAPGRGTPEALPQRAPEAAPGGGSAESREVAATGQSSGGDPAFQAALPPVLPQSQPAHVADPAAADPAGSGNPLIAEDNDLIEKEWVDRAKQVVNATKHDPFLQEREISKLQADYLKKRYGKDVVVPSD